jgi:hypothetical protein
MPTTKEVVPVTKSREEKTTEGIETISPVVIFSCSTYAPGNIPAAKKAKAITLKNLRGFTFIKINKRVFAILTPSLTGCNLDFDAPLRLGCYNKQIITYPAKLYQKNNQIIYKQCST